MRKHGMLFIALAVIGLAGTALAQTMPALAVGTPATGQVAADPSMTLTIAQPQEIIIDAVATDGTDAQVRLMRDGSFVAEDSDSGEGTNARLATFVTPGTYQVIVYEYQYRAMTANVTAAVAPPMTPVATIATGAPPTRVSTPEGDWARAASVEVALTVASPGNYTITATPDAAPAGEIGCSPEITVIHDMAVDGYPISNSGSGTPATATRALVAGAYTLRMRNWFGHVCNLTLTVAPAP